MASAGDVNGDSYSDAIVGAYTYSNGYSQQGKAFVYLGSTTGLTTTAAWTAEGQGIGENFGYSVATAGDVNGDGYPDVIVGALYSGADDRGRAYLYYGNGGDGLDRTPRQLRPSEVTPISLLAQSAFNAVRLRTLGRTPAGRGNVRLEWEAKPLGTAFSTTGHTLGSPFNTGVPVLGVGSATPLFGLASDLTPNTPYHWRLRVLADSPFFPRSPWVSMPGNNSTETDFRSGPSGALDVSETAIGAGALRVEMIHPNPSGAQATILYALTRAGLAQLWIHDLQGRRVALLVDGAQTAGPHSIAWDGRNQNGRPAGPGVYWVRLRSAGDIVARKFVRE